MRIKLTPDKGVRVEKARLNGVPTLILRPADREPVNIGLMWIHGGGFITGMKEMVYMSRAAASPAVAPFSRSLAPSSTMSASAPYRSASLWN